MEQIHKKSLFSFNSEIPLLPKDISLYNLIIPLFIVFFILYVLFRTFIIKFTTKSFNKTTKSLYFEGITKTDDENYIEMNIILRLILFFNNQSNKLKESIRLNELKKKQDLKKQNLFKNK